MNKYQAIIHYRLAMSVNAKWLAVGILSEEELAKLELLLDKKYKKKKKSIYR